MELADPMNPDTYNEENTIYVNNTIRSALASIPEDRWHKAFGYKWMSFVWKANCAQRFVSLASQRT